MLLFFHHVVFLPIDQPDEGLPEWTIGGVPIGDLIWKDYDAATGTIELNAVPDPNKGFFKQGFVLQLGDFVVCIYYDSCKCMHA